MSIFTRQCKVDCGTTVNQSLVKVPIYRSSKTKIESAGLQLLTFHMSQKKISAMITPDSSGQKLSSRAVV